MNKKKILFIAWKACERNKSWFYSKHPWQYESAVALIWFTGIIHLLQCLVVVRPFGLFKERVTIDGLGYVILLTSFAASYFLCQWIFPKRVLAEAIELYEGSKMGKYAKLIAYSYFIINFVLMMAIGIWLLRPTR